MNDLFSGNIAQQALLSLIPSGVGVFELTGDIVKTEFLNDGYYQMLGDRRDSRKQFSGTGTLGAVHPDDTPGLLAEAHASIREHRLFTYTFRVLDGSGDYRWVSIHANHIPVSDSTERFYASYSDIDELVRTRDKLQTNEILYSDIFTYSEISHFIYYPQQHRYEAAAQPKRLNDLPASMDDFPDGFIRCTSISRSDASLFREMVGKIDAGETEADCTVQMQFRNKFEWCRIHMHRAGTSADKALRVVGTVTNITPYAEAQQAFSQEKLRMQSLQRDMLSVACFNVTADRILDHTSSSTLNDSGIYGAAIFDEASALDPQITAQRPETLGLLLCTAEQIPNEKQRHEFLRLFSHCGMLHFYDEGLRDRTIEFRRRTSGRGIIWISMRIVLLPDPESRDILAFLYTYDINDRVIYRKMAEKILSSNYESLAYFDISSGKFYKKLEGVAFEALKYETALESMIREDVAASEAETMRSACSLRSILSGLRNADTYTVYYTSQRIFGQMPGHPYRRIKNDIFFLDDSRDTLVFLRSDATEMEESMRAREEARSLEQTIHHIPAGLAVFRRTGDRIRLIMINDFLCSLVGAARETVLGKDVTDLLPLQVLPDSRDLVSGSLLQLFSDAGEASCTYHARRPVTGGSIWIHVSGRAVKQSDGSGLAYAVFSDMTEQKQKELEFDRKIRELSSVNPNTLAVYRLNLTQNSFFPDTDAAGSGILPASADSADACFDQVLLLICDLHDREKYAGSISREKLMESCMSGTHDLSCEFRYRDPDTDDVRWATEYFYTEKNPRTGDVETVASIIDTNEQILSRQIMSRITGEDYDYFALIDADKNRIRFINVREAAKESTPHHFACYDDDLRDALPRLMKPEEAGACYDRICLASVRRGLRDSTVYEFSFTVTMPGGAQYRKQLKYRWLDDSRETIFLTRLDITASWRQEQDQLLKMEEALHAAEAANADKTEFLSRISHDIRTPINISINMTDFAMQDMADTEKLKNDLEKIRSANTFLLSLISDVLDVSKIDSGKFEFSPEPYPYEEYTKDIRNMLEPMCAQKHLHCVFERRNRTSGVIYADKVRLRQITLNLLSNAVKFTPEGGTVRYESDSEDLPDSRIRFGFVISDTGIGMSEDFQKIMFDPFSQEYSNPARPKNMTGTGLGLSIVKKMVDLMDGTITVESRPGCGTSIRCSIIFPDALRDLSLRNTAAAAAVPENAAHRLSGRILLAEDNALNAEIAVRLLEDLGLQTDAAENGKEAVAMFSDAAPGTYQAILMDIQMPLMNGYEAAECIRALDRPDAGSIPIIAMTADVFTEAAEHAKRSGMNAHLPKPLDSARIYAALLPWLGPPQS